MWILCKTFSILIILFSVFSGCSVHPNTFSKKNLEKYSVRRVAVIPFYNNTTAKTAGKVVTNCFVEELLNSKDIEVEFPGNVRKLLVEERIIIRKGIGSGQIRLIGKRLNVDAVIIGRVTEYGGDDGSGSPVVSVNARIIHTDTSSILWMGQNKRTGDDYIKVFDIGRIDSAPKLARNVVRELILTID